MLPLSLLLLPNLVLALPHVLEAKRQAVTSNEVLWNTAQWTYNGLRNGSIEAWLGVPYAQPPVGNLRFKAPVAFDPNAPVTAEVRSAQAYGKVCPQTVSL